MWDAIRAILSAVFPPSPGASPERQYRWSVAITTFALAIGGLSVANTVAMFGLLPALFAGFAHADTVPTLAQRSDVTALRQSVDVLASAVKQSQVATLGQQIYNLRVMECNARKAKNFEAASSHGKQLDDLKISYRSLAGYDYPIRDCTEL